MNACSSSSYLSLVCNCEASSDISDHNRKSAIRQRFARFKRAFVWRKGIEKESHSFNWAALRSSEIEMVLM